MGKENRVSRICVSLPAGLLRELDRRVIRRGYASRSEFVSDLIREQMVEDEWAAGEKEVVGVLTITYDHHQPGLPQRLINVQHRNHINVLCTTHVHLDRGQCLETIIIKGRPQEIERLAIRSGGLRGVRFAKLTRAAMVAI